MSFDNIHPLVIHFPIALLSVSVLFDGLHIIFKQDRFQVVSRWNLTLGMIGAVFAVITGIFADTLIGHMAEPFPLLKTHGSTQLISFSLFLILFVWRWKLKGNLPEKRSRQIIYLMLGLISVACLFYGSHLGAILAGRI